MKKNVFGKVMDFIGLGDDEDDLDFDEIEEIEVEENIEPYVPLSKKGKNNNWFFSNYVETIFSIKCKEISIHFCIIGELL